jgi:diaminopimelate decarboxylase
MNHFGYRHGALHCEDVALATIAQAVGTPAYVYSTATLRRHAQVLKEALAAFSPLIAFAVKANPNIAVLSVLADEGLGADTVSAGEIRRALAAGVAPENIIFAGVGKSAEELAFALQAGIGQINVESPAELDLLAEIAHAQGKVAPVALRINPAIGAGGHDKIATGGADAKFGVSIVDAPALCAKVHASPALNLVGLAVHIGSQIKELPPLEEAFGRLRHLAENMRAEGFPLPRLDLGGGLGVPYFHEPDPPDPAAYAAMITRVFEGYEAHFAFEPGRMIAANAGVLLTKVLRRQPRPNRDVIVLDAGMNDLIRPAMYEAYHDLWPVQRHPDAQTERVDLVGPVCETGDTFAKDRAMPRLEEGDLAAFMTAGAYGAAMASTYNARPLAPEVLVDGADFHVVRARWTVEDQMQLETLPPWRKA